MADYYLYFKFLHYIFFISWMAMLFYQPRLYVYHAENIHNPEYVKVVEVMEYKMYKYIGYPALIGSFATGALILLAMPDLIKTGHIHLKLMIVILMAAYHFHLGSYMKQLKNKTCKRDGMFFRAYNEVPTVCMLVIIWIMIVNPF
ncbi:TIGR00701 family protein [Campylobacter pinnipediorum subsp. caledonicus]|uniref:protoporphyrinogen oxidase HemJ n=1 Tax=Campylobacter pinnipediorum TaxID=1965231 RepID=UPI0009950CB6|nr:protoporphyrinogen oxidase HemJ [Campylobacter pinnipediorum]OPA71022.1 TIGR00701 family protein [Campylobacter pinnipediorum subsp. caledonicus]